MFQLSQRKIILLSLIVCLLGASVLQTSACFAASAQATSASTSSINPKVLSLALKAHHKAHRMGVARKPLLTIIDYSLPSTKPRLWVMDVATTENYLSHLMSLMVKTQARIWHNIFQTNPAVCNPVLACL